MGPLPAWRTDLEVRQRDDGSVDVRDPRLLQVFSLDKADWMIAQLFDGTRDAATIAAGLASQGFRIPAARIAQIALDYAEIYLLDTPEARRAQPTPDNNPPWSQLEAGRRSLKVLPQAQPEARWSCHRCGECCHGLAVELSAAEEARIDRSLYRDVLGDRPFVERAFIDPDSPAKRVLRHKPGPREACIFLGEDHLCLVHKRQGSAAKPNACQAFLLVVVHPPVGAPRLGMRVNCESMWKSFEDGEPIERSAPFAKKLGRRLSSQRIDREILYFQKVVRYSELDPIFRGIAQVLNEDGPTPEVLSHLDRRYFGGRLARARVPYAKRLLRYLADEVDHEIPVEEGGYRAQVVRVPRALDALRALARGKRRPLLRPKVRRFLARQLDNVLYLHGPSHWPDAGFGLLGLFLGLEAALLAIGEKGTLSTANRAFMVFTSPVLETTTHAWPILDAIDQRYAQRLRKEL
ncbi:MAG: YkgJ family cysteine cluster protein [Deltaproteobacteria bacterium]|nr:YkgJ family cysteine cluster protein [Deltaproteobacteria bacterium]